MTKTEQKIEQCKKDTETLQTNPAKLEAEKVKEHKLVPGDLAKNCWNNLRLIVCVNREVHGVGIDGSYQASEGSFKDVDYKKIGRISDFIKETS